MLSGAVAGVVILGLVGKIAMVIVSLLMGSNTNLSLSGIYEAIIIGTVFGIIGGLIQIPVGRIKEFSMFVQGIVIGLILFALSILLSTLFTRMKFDFSVAQLLTFAAIFGIYVFYGVSVITIVNWFRSRGAETSFKN
jgi:hypothetical protein